MTNEFSQPSVPYNTGSAADKTVIIGPSPLHWRTFNLPKSDPDLKANGGLYDPDEVIGWELKIDDLRGGNLQVGDFAKGAPGSYGFSPTDGDYRGTASSTLDQRFSRYLLLPARNTGSAPTPTGSQFISHTTVFDQLVQAQANTPGGGRIVLFKEVAGAGGPSMTSISYAPAGPILGLSPILQGGTTINLLVMCAGAAPEILSDLTTGGPTSVGSMHANLTSTYAMAQSPINATTPGTATNLFYAGTSIYTLAVSSAIGAAPTQVQSGINAGGYGLGVETLLLNLPLRWFLFIPDSGIAAGVLSSAGVPKAGHVTHYNMEGTDPQTVPFSLARQLFSCLWQKQAVATDGVQIKAWDGDNERDLNFLKGRPANSDMQVTCQGLIVNGRDLISITCHNDLTVSGTTIGNSYYQYEQYLPEFDSWLAVSAQIAPTEINSVAVNDTFIFGRQMIIPCAPTQPLSKQTGIPYVSDGRTSMNRDSIFLPPSGANPFDLYRQTGASANNTKAYESTGTWTSPYFELPQLEGKYKRADEIVFLGDADAGGTAATVGIAINGGSPVNFGAGLTLGANVAQTSNTGDDALWMQLQIAITLTRGSTITKTPNGLPVMIRGRAYLKDPTSDNEQGGI